MAKEHKVFCIGFMKTGTTTLNRALSLLGYRVSHNSWRWLNDIVKEDWDAIGRKVKEWDALEDNPIPLIFRELDRLFPGSKFILTLRDEKRWYDSVSYHIEDLPTPMHTWLFGKGKQLPKDDKEHTLAVYRGHIHSVRNYFKDRPGDLLEIDVTQLKDWDELCQFLGEPIPEHALPHANRTQYETDKHSGLRRRLKYWKKRLINPIKIWNLDQKGYLPSPKQRIDSL